MLSVLLNMNTSETKDKLLRLYNEVEEGCIDCGLCQKDCKFLQKYGSPKQIAQARSLDPGDLRTSFECSLCWLCTAVCPKDIDPAAMFGAMRDQAHITGHGEFKEHTVLLRYEQWGVSPLISWYGLPTGCTTVLFPGCAMAGTRSARIFELYSHLKKSLPSLGIVLDCCTKPSHDLGRKDYFSSMFGALRDALVEKGVQEVLVACPSCYRVWKDYGRPVKVRSVYEQLDDTGPVNHVTGTRQVTMHDPCPTRYDGAVHAAVRNILGKMGFTLREMKHHAKKTLCCGEGGAACYVAPEFAGNFTESRAQEGKGDHMVTYCAGCTHFLGKQTAVSHIVDLYFDPEQTLAGREPVARSPWTWLKRLLLKRSLKKQVSGAVTGSRDRNGTVQLDGSS